jgi:carbamoyltransferase
VNDWLNEKLGRTEFMPFAPSTLIESADLCYEGYKKALHSGKFMTVTFECTDWMKRKCPGAVHVDGTARPQLVDKKYAPSLHRIIDEYRKITGIPIIINTSFNMHEEPIVENPGDAIRAFFSAKLDYLAVGNYLVKGGN